MAGKDDWDNLSYYEVLQVNPNATTDEIKKAYKRMALKWHPDKNPDNLEEADKVFKLVGEAYEVLSNSEKRQIYDQCGKEGLREGAGGGGGFHFASAEDIFREFFGTNDPFANFFGDFGMFGGGQRGSGHTGGGGGIFGGSFGFGGFGGGFGSDFHDLGGGMSFASFGNGGGFSSMSSSSTTRRGGKTVTTKTTVKNGVKTVEVIENGELVSKTVDGQPVAIEGGSYSSKPALDNGFNGSDY